MCTVATYRRHSLGLYIRDRPPAASERMNDLRAYTRYARGWIDRDRLLQTRTPISRWFPIARVCIRVSSPRLERRLMWLFFFFLMELNFFYWCGRVWSRCFCFDILCKFYTDEYNRSLMLFIYVFPFLLVRFFHEWKKNYARLLLSVIMWFIFSRNRWEIINNKN